MTIQTEFEEQYTKRNRIATEAYVMVMLTVFPVFTGTNGYIMLHLKKYLFFLAATIIWVVFLGVNGILRLLSIRRMPHLTLPTICIFAFVILATISTIISKYAVFFSTVVGKYDNLLTYLLYAAIVLGVYHYGANHVRCLWAFAISYTLCCLIALLQLCGWNALWLFPEGFSYYSDYVQETSPFLGTLGNIDLFSALHCLAIPLFVGVVALCKSPRRFFLLLPLGMGLCCQIIAGVASGLLALCLAAILLAPVYIAWQMRETGKRVPNRWVYFGGCLGLAIVLLLLYVIPFGSGTLYEFHQALHGNLDDSFGSHRILIWRESIAVFRNHFWMGIGPDTLEYYLDITFERFSEALGETLHTTVDNAHNTYLQLLLNYGVLGTIPISILMVETFDEIRISFSSSVKIRVLCIPMLCYMVQAFFNNGTCIVVPLFLILWGIILNDNCRCSEVLLNVGTHGQLTLPIE